MKDVDLIKARVVRHFRLTEEDLDSASQRQEVAYPRHIAMALTRELTRMSLPDIGLAIGNRDHTTVKHAIDNVEHWVELWTPLGQDYCRLRADIHDELSARWSKRYRRAIDTRDAMANKHKLRALARRLEAA